MKREGPWKCRAMDAEENLTQVFLRVHSPWKSLRDSHIPTAPAAKPVGKWKSICRIPTFPPALLPHSKPNQKGGPAADRFIPSSRLILQ